MKILRFAAVGVAAALALTACSSGDDTSDQPSDNGTPEAATIKLWLNGTDTPQALRDYLTTTFEKENPGSKLVIEEQDWSGLVPRLQTALASEDQTPDVVEIGNTQSPTFTYAGAFADITGMYDELGGDKLLPGFVEAGKADGKLYSVPYYSGARAVFYNKDAFAAAGVEVPTTLADFTTVAQKLQTDAVSGFWFPGQDWYNGAAWIYTNGGDLATYEGGTWKGGLSSEKSLKGLEEVQTLFKTATHAPADSDSNEPWVPFNAGQAAMFSAPTWARWSIDLPQCNKGVAADDKSDAAKALLGEQQACNEEHTGIFPLPGLTADKVATGFAGGSNIAVAAKSKHPELAKNLLRIIFSGEFQNQLGENGLIPGNSSYATSMGDDVYAKAAVAAALNAKLTPAAENWATVEGDRILEDFFQKVASGADVKQAAADADKLIEDALN
ncbi:sugar ABC transporter substrate-binding protein [Cellulomonas chitinilytica]|uniref:Sugar ABC transporter substrate-binding protein n=1 Tax=Cellulomonas chitinilytica TaxID=398759 RepID=A0A919P3J7_9CELL|nr:extracellular solute-binding protein [Cellulomonas chitinilytica]GIG22781.1 sugar ABC transporter substrate-binding protein [Cellulomonas chitinilytica]